MRGCSGRCRHLCPPFSSAPKTRVEKTIAANRGEKDIALSRHPGTSTWAQFGAGLMEPLTFPFWSLSFEKNFLREFACFVAADCYTGWRFNLPQQLLSVSKESVCMPVRAQLASAHGPKVVVCESSSLSCQLLADTIQRGHHLRVVGLATNNADLISAVQDTEADIAVIGTELKNGINSGIIAVQQLRGL